MGADDGGIGLAGLIAGLQLVLPVPAAVVAHHQDHRRTKGAAADGSQLLSGLLAFGNIDLLGLIVAGSGRHPACLQDQIQSLLLNGHILERADRIAGMGKLLKCHGDDLLVFDYYSTDTTLFAIKILPICLKSCDFSCLAALKIVEPKKNSMYPSLIIPRKKEEVDDHFLPLHVVSAVSMCRRAKAMHWLMNSLRLISQASASASICSRTSEGIRMEMTSFSGFLGTNFSKTLTCLS